MVRVKICGITKWEDAKLAADLGAHAIGLNFFEGSPRCITPFAAVGIAPPPSSVRCSCRRLRELGRAPVVALCKALGLSAAQLHGDETPQVVDAVARRLPSSKPCAWGREMRSRFFQLSRRLRFSARFRSFLDTTVALAQPEIDLARAVAQFQRIILAGGVTPENVAEAIRIVRPYAVDVASGVEARPGKKDPIKLRTFFDEVNRASREIS